MMFLLSVNKGQLITSTCCQKTLSKKLCNRSNFHRTWMLTISVLQHLLEVIFFCTERKFMVSTHICCVSKKQDTLWIFAIILRL